TTDPPGWPSIPWCWRWFELPFGLMPHIDYDQVTSLDALINLSDAAARATLVRLRERLAQVDEALCEQVVFDGRHQKPVIAFYRGEDAVLHLWPEPNVQV